MVPPLMEYRMKACGFFVSFLLLAVPSFSQKREIVELQREIATLQDQVRVIQRSLDEKMGALQAMVQQSFDAASKGSTGVAVLEGGIRNSLREQEKAVGGLVAGLGAKMDQMATEFTALRESVTDVNSKMTRLQAQMVDVTNSVKTLQSPPSPPPGAAGGTSGGSGPPAGVSAASLYDNGRRDLSSGNYDLAIQVFSDYIRYFPNTDLAPNAQYYIGEAYFNKNDIPSALAAFDLVLEKYPENNKTEDALYMKGKALLKNGERMKAAQEFRDLLRRKPRPDLDQKARAELKTLGLSPGTSTKKRD